MKQKIAAVITDILGDRVIVGEAMRKNKSIFFKPIGGSAPLSIYFYESGNLGDAVEANNEVGVGWFFPNGELLAVQFDDVEEKKTTKFSNSIVTRLMLRSVKEKLLTQSRI
jgi:hypothetical protein